jgi:hypothetical protein
MKEGTSGMDDSTSAKCQECGIEELMYTRDSEDLERASDAIPYGWRVWREQSGELRYLCPTHSGNSYFAQYSGDNVVEG